MNKLRFLSPLLLFLLIAQPAWSRGGGRPPGPPVHAKITVRSHDELMAAWRIKVQQTLAIEKYNKFANQLEIQKKWADAESNFRYVLKLVALRDGPGSPKSVPVLEHLVKLNEIQKNTDKAMSYQETALLLIKAQDPPNKQAILDNERSLGELYVQMAEYKDAESVLKDAMIICKAEPSVPVQSRSAVYQTYGRVLRQLHKDAEAQAIEASPDYKAPQTDEPVTPIQGKNEKKLVSKS
jgi:hypothetical protein